MSLAGLDLTTTPLTLPPDVKILAVADLAPRLRTRIGAAADGQSVVTRPGVRTTARLMPPPLAALVAEFRTPSLVADAVLRFATAHEQSAEDTIDLAFDALAALVEARILVPEGSPDALAPAPTLAAGQSFAGLEITALVRSLDDSEVYRGVAADGVAVALKVGRAGHHGIRAMLAREAAVLRSLPDGLAPRLRDAGDHDGRPYLVIDWCDGVSVAVAAQQARSAHDRRRLRTLATRVAAAYARLHAEGVLHGDVHPGNCLVRDDGRVVLIDFGAAGPAQRAGDRDPARTGIPQFHDPEMAAALLAGELPPAADARAEQYAVAALVHLLVTGLPPVDTTAERETLLRGIVERPLPPFVARGVAPWPALERVLARALAKRASDRFVSMDEFAAALAGVTVPATTPRPPDRAAGRAAAVTRDVLTAIDAGGPDVRTPEHAWLTLQAAQAFGDPTLLAQAEILLEAAAQDWRAHAVAIAVARARSDARREGRAASALVEAATAVPAAERERAVRAARSLMRGAAWEGPSTAALRGFARDHGDSAEPVSLETAAEDTTGDTGATGRRVGVWSALRGYQQSGDVRHLRRARRALARSAGRAPALDVATAWVALQAPESAMPPPWRA